MVGGHDGLAIKFNVNTWNTGNDRPGGDHDVLGFQRFGLAVIAGHQNRIGGGNRSRSMEYRDLVLLHQEGDAVHIGFHRGILMSHHGWQIELGLAGFDAELLKSVLRLVEHFRRMQQRL